MKKLLSIILAVTFIVVLFVPALADETENDKTLKFNDDGSFRIMQINDTQDMGRWGSKRTVEFIAKALDELKPDLVVIVGDQLSEYYFIANEKDMTLSIKNILKPMEERGIPFLMTLGNHDHDNIDKFTEDEQYAVYADSAMCYAAENGTDPFTYSVPVMSSDGESVALNVYMMNTHNKAEAGGYAGVNKEQVEWYKNTSVALKSKNGGNAVPSMLFQHIPPKEIYSLLEESDVSDKSAVYSGTDEKWYTLVDGAEGFLGEAPCSENFDNVTGQYEAWLECGDIIGAFFGHDHVNTFMGTNSDGITMGYNGGTGFRSYGLGANRSVRIFDFKENDIENYETSLITYAQLTGIEKVFVITDKVSVLIFTPIMRVVHSVKAFFEK